MSSVQLHQSAMELLDKSGLSICVCHGDKLARITGEE